MSPEEWLKSQQSDPMSPEEWLKSQAATTQNQETLTPVASQKPTDVTEDLSKPAFLAPKQRITAIPRAEEKSAVKDDQEKVETIPFADLYNNKDNLKKIEDYATARFGKTGQREKGETDEQYVNRFARHMRWLESNLINYTTEQKWLNNAKPEDVLKAGEVYNMFNKTAGFFSREGQNPLRAIADYAMGTVSDPLALVSFGAGKITSAGALKKLGSEGLKKTILSRTGATAIGVPMAIETGTNVTTNVYGQKRELSVAKAQAQKAREILPQLDEEQQKKYLPQIEALERKVEEGIDIGEAAFTGAITAPFSLALETGPLIAASRKAPKLLGDTGKELRLQDLVDAQKKQLDFTDSPTKLTGDPNVDNVTVTTTNIYDGRNLLDEQGDPTAIAQMQIKNSVDKQTTEIAASIWKQMPEMAPIADEKTFEAVQRTLDSFNKLPDNVIKQSLEDAGTDLPNFLARLEASGLDTDALQKLSAMYGTSISDAARSMQSLSVQARMINRLREIDPESAKAVDALLGKKNAVVEGFAPLRWIRNIDRNLITGMTTNASTLARNIFGVGVNAGPTYGAAEDFIESYLFNIGRKVAGNLSGKPVTGDIGRGFYGAIDDAVDTWYYLGQAELSKDITEEALKNNPMLMSKLLATAEEMKNSDLWKPIQILNTPAVIMDNYVRRAVFASSIDYHLRQTGMDLVDLVAKGKNIPIDILRKGVDDALEMTFSKSPTDPIGSNLVKLVEATRPISTMVTPFARFMVNATKWTLKHYNPGITATQGAYEFAKGVNMLRNGDDAGQSLIFQGSKRVAQQATGLATFLAAYSYREQNQDKPWNIMASDDGTTVDIKYLFPFNVPFALADYAVKTRNGNPEDFKTRDLIEATTGFKNIGTQTEMVDLARDAMTNAVSIYEEGDTDETSLNKLKEAWPKIAGAWLGRGTVPLNQVSDIVAAFDADEGLPRDIFVAKPGERLSDIDIMGRYIQRGIPFAKQSLPVTQSPTRAETPQRDGGLLKQVTGLATIDPKNEIEAEIERLNIPYSALFKTTGDKTVDNSAKLFLAQHIDKYVLPVMNSESYKNSTAEGQFMDLSKALAKAQTSAKNIAIAKSRELFYAKGEVPPIDRKMFEENGIKLRRAAIQLYNSRFETNFVDDKDPLKYAKINELVKVLKRSPTAVQKKTTQSEQNVEPQEFAAGGAVGKQALKAVGKKGLLDQSSLLLKEIEAAATKSAPTPTPTNAIGQMADVLSGAPAPVPAKPVKKPAPAAKKAPLEAQTEEAIPSPTPKEEIAPAPSAAFTDDDYKLGEKFMLESGAYDEDMLKNMKSANYEGYMDLVHSSTGMAKGIKYKDMPPSPFKAKEVFEENVDIEGRPLSEIKPAKTVKLSEEPTYIVKGAEEGDLNRLAEHIGSDATFTSDRNKVLNTLKELRKDTFFDMQNDMAFDKYDEEVLGVLQGEYRYAKGVELDPSNPAMVKDALPMADALQKRLDKLREQYKDKPPVVLFHGQGSGNVENVRKGFLNPQKLRGTKHDELLVGAPSFTKDLNLNFRSEKFGSIDPENYVATEIPYADYVFSRVNMRPAEYDSKDLNVLARSVSGTRFQARPISLPRGQFGEHEDIFVDAEKLKIKNSSAAARVEDLVTGEKSLLPEQLSGKVQKTRELLTSTSKLDNITPAQAYKAYKEVRDTTAMLTYMSRNVQPYGGRGQQASVRMEQLIDGPERYTQLTKIADALEDAGSKEKAVKLRRFARRADVYNKSDKGLGDVDMAPEKQDATIQDMRKKRLDKVFKASEQLAKGGFVSKRR